MTRHLTMALAGLLAVGAWAQTSATRESIQPNMLIAAGSIGYGRTSAPLTTPTDARWVSLKFLGRTGDRVNIQIRMKTGRPEVVLVDKKLQRIGLVTGEEPNGQGTYARTTLPIVADGEPQEYQVLVRDSLSRKATFTVGLQRDGGPDMSDVTGSGSTPKSK